MLNKIKLFAVIALVSFIAGGVTGWKLRAPVIKDKSVIAEPPKRKTLKNPDNADFNTLRLWSKSPIEIEYKIINQSADFTSLNVRAFDANKSTDQEIKVPVAEIGDWKIYAGIGAGSALAAVVTGRYLYKRLK